jgi:hypothetical protein
VFQSELFDKFPLHNNRRLSMTRAIARHAGICLVLFVFLLSSSAIAQIDGMLGMRWGTSREEVMAALAALPGTTFNPKPVDSTDVVFYGGTYGGDPISFILASIGSKGFYSGSVVLERIDSEAERMEQFNRIREEITAAYGIEPTVREKPDELLGWQWDTRLERTSLTISRKSLKVSMTYFTIDPRYKD